MLKIDSSHRDAAWWYWLATIPLLLGAVVGCEWSLAAAVALTAVQGVHFIQRAGGATALDVQVRAGYLALLVLGTLPGLGWIHGVQLIGTSARVAFGYCLLAREMSLLPWNRSDPITGRLLVDTFFSMAPAHRHLGCGGSGHVSAAA